MGFSIAYLDVGVSYFGEVVDLWQRECEMAPNTVQCNAMGGDDKMRQDKTGWEKVWWSRRVGVDRWDKVKEECNYAMRVSNFSIRCLLVMVRYAQ